MYRTEYIAPNRSNEVQGSSDRSNEISKKRNSANVKKSDKNNSDSEDDANDVDFFAPVPPKKTRSNRNVAKKTKK